jgi:DNA-binding MarR family transcriptional regulator
MARARPVRSGRPRPVNTAVLLRDAFAVINGVVPLRLAEQGYAAVRGAHGVVFQYLDDDGTTVSALADRAQMTKQAMAELVLHLEQHDYVRRVPDPRDHRAKLVQPTEKGREVIAIAQGLVPEMERRLIQALGRTRWQELRKDLETIQDLFGGDGRAAEH